MVECTAKPHRAITDEDFEAMRRVSSKMYWRMRRNSIVLTMVRKLATDTRSSEMNEMTQEVIQWLTSNTSDLYYYQVSSGGRAFHQVTTVSFFNPDDALAFKLRFDGCKSLPKDPAR
ncbi:MAG: hypothetical protein EOP83_03975 [Verrucomicrobiaceae bacterium]|nr:MAG: hypothetical protein EOP83_03975 [Verrucomicrobiaceae bacterium]